MKILIIITDYGSFNNFLAELATEVSKKYQVHIVCSHDNVINIKDKFIYNKFDILFHKIDIPRSISLKKQITAALEIRKLIKFVKPDVVHAHFTTGILPSILLKVKGIPYLGTFHGLGLNASSGFRRLIFLIVEFFCFLRLDEIYLMNKKDFTLVKTFFSNKTKKYNSFGVGCDLDKFNRSNFLKDENFRLKQDLGIQNKFVITYTGRFVEFKGFDLVYNVFKLLDGKYPNEITLLLIGGRDPIHKTGLNDKDLFELENNKSIINVGYTSTVEKYLAITDVFLFPSKKEGLPVCIMESLAMGVPVISLNERGNSDLIINGFNGFLIESVSKNEDVNLLVNKLEYLIVDRKFLDVLSLNCKIEREKYSRGLFVDEHIKIYSSLLNRSI
jgi:glycosyltransferase involved in cell wall biosynthesis